MEQNKQPVAQYYYSEKEWDRLGCGPLPEKRKMVRPNEKIITRANPWTDGKVIKGSN